MVINIDQKSVPFILISKKLDEKGTSRVSVLDTADYRQITGTFSIAMAGSFLPIQLIYHGKIPLSQSKYNFLKEFYVTQIPTHWAHEEASIAFLEHVLIAYIESQGEELNSSSQWLLVSDVCKGHWTDHIKEIVRRFNAKMVSIPDNWTSYYQTLDLTVNKSCKDFLQQETQKWYSEEISKQMAQGKIPMR